MKSAISQSRNSILLVCLFGLISIWNIPHTIAARHLFAVLLILIVVTAKPDWRAFFQRNKTLLVLFAYLAIHLIFFSNDFESALSNFVSEWMKLILFALLGVGTGLLVIKSNSRMLMLLLALAFSTPLLIHLGLSIQEGLNRGEIPWGYFGISGAQSISGTHGDLAYAAIPATIFSSAFFLYQAKSYRERILALALLTACVASPLIANSRAGTATVLILLMFMFLINLAIKFNDTVGRTERAMGFMAVLLVLIGVVTIGSTADPARWTGVSSRLEMGMKADPLEVICEGVDVVRETLNQEGRTITPEISQALISIQERQDGARVMTARAAARLSWANPMGIDQSKHAYQIAISEVCDPAISLSNAHNGWIDTALAIGIPGAILYLLVLLNFVKLGFRHMKLDNADRPFAVALFITSTIWILRALVDSTQRDQVLEMQIFTVTFLYGLLVNPTTGSRAHQHRKPAGST